jgi:hypothetical protein
MDLLVMSGTGNIVHDKRKGSRPLLSHLIGTKELLQQAGYSQDICTAGLLHSVYGTNRFTIACIDPEQRQQVRAVAGEEAERLAWLFHAINRPRTLHKAIQIGLWDANANPAAKCELQGRSEGFTLEVVIILRSFRLFLLLCPIHITSHNRAGHAGERHGAGRPNRHRDRQPP